MSAIKSFRIERPERARHALDQARPVQLLASLNFFEGGSMRSWVAPDSYSRARETRCPLRLRA